MKSDSNEALDFYTQDELANLLHCEVHRVIQFRQAGLLRGTRFGRRWIYRKNDVEAFVNESLGKDFTNFTDLSEEGLKKYCN